MLTILICIIIGLIAGIYVAYNDKVATSPMIKIGEIFLNVLFGLFIGILLMGCISIFLEELVPTKPYVVNTYKVIALKDNSSTEGSFFLGCGTVDEELTYCAMVEYEDGAAIEYFDVERTYIKEVERDYRIEHINYCYENNILNYFFNCSKTKDIIYIPKDSICTDYKIDME